jgi:ribosomal protein L11 methyltransferase
MAWHEISIRAPHEYVEPISYLFTRYGRGLSMESDGLDHILLRTYLPATSSQRLAHIEVGVKLVSILEPLGELAILEVPEKGWESAWKSHFTLLKVGRRIVVKPTWIEYEPEAEEVVIELDPGMAFGTGYHPTTYTSLEAMEQLVGTGSSALDLGTGSGILAIAAIRLGASNVVALDIDPQALRAARRNLRRTGTTRRIKLVQGTLPDPAVRQGQFDLVVANISARAICDRAPFIVSALRAEGVLIASGMLKAQGQEVLDTLKELGCSLIQEWPRDDWVTLAFHPGPVQQGAGREGLAVT